MLDLYVIAGEYSGDFIGGNLLRQLKVLKGDLSFAGIGGDLMKKQGMDSLFSIDKINLMGFLEILPHIFRLKRLVQDTIDDILQKKPKVLVTIDSPGFTYRVAKAVKAKNPGIKLIHIVAPSVWAYKPSRAKKYAEVYDYLLTILPFEPPYFTKHGLQAEFIGHPVIEQDFYQKNIEAIKKKIIVITPGSRVGEIKRHMPIIKEALDILSKKRQIEANFVQADLGNKELIESYLSGSDFAYKVSTDRLKSFAYAACALAKSGTNTLEIIASRTPMVVGYKLNWVTFRVLKAIMKIKYASLVNIMAGREIIPEYIQNNFTPEKIATALEELLTNKDKAESQVEEGLKILSELGFESGVSPSAKAAKIIYERFL